jgi:hypothetical protein
MSPKILLGGPFEIVIGRGNFLSSWNSPFNVQEILIVGGQAEVSAVRFSPTPLPDPGEFARWSDAL